MGSGWGAVGKRGEIRRERPLFWGILHALGPTHAPPRQLEHPFDRSGGDMCYRMVARSAGGRLRFASRQTAEWLRVQLLALAMVAGATRPHRWAVPPLCAPRATRPPAAIVAHAIVSNANGCHWATIGDRGHGAPPAHPSPPMLAPGVRGAPLWGYAPRGP